MKKITPHEGSPSVTIRMNLQNAEGCFGNEIDPCGICNIEIPEDREEENTNEDCAEFVGIHYEKGQRKTAPRLCLQECEQDHTEVTESHGQQKKSQGLPQIRGPFRWIQAKVSANEIDSDKPEHLSEDRGIHEYRG